MAFTLTEILCSFWYAVICMGIYRLLRQHYDPPPKYLALCMAATWPVSVAVMLIMLPYTNDE